MHSTAWRAGACAALLLGTLWTSKAIDSRAPRQLEQPLESVATQIDGWTAVDDPPLLPTVAGELKATSYIMRTYFRGPEALGLFIAYYSRQQPGENMHSPRNCLPGNGWSIVAHGYSTVPVRDRVTAVNHYVIESGLNRRSVLYWYQTRDRIIANEYAAKLHLFWTAFREANTSGVLARVTVTDTPGALESGLKFAAAAIPEIQRCLGKPRDQ